MVTESNEGEHAHSHDSLVIRVRYIAAREPFVEPHASTEESLATFKQCALAFFGLDEGPANGGTKTYFLAQDGVALTDLTVTLGIFCQGKHELKFDLIERFEQG